MFNLVNQTTLIIIGTFHGAHRELNNYSVSVLQKLIEKSNPDVVALEIRENDWAAGDFSNNPWDMNEIAIPFCKTYNIPIEPIDWWPNNLREKYNQFVSDLKKTPDGVRTLELMNNEWAPHLDRCSDYKNVTAEYTHSTEFAKKDSNLRIQIKDIVGEGPQNLFWFTRSQKMNQNIEKVILKYPGKRITVIVGAFHRGDVENYFKDKVILEPVFEFDLNKPIRPI